MLFIVTYSAVFVIHSLFGNLHFGSANRQQLVVPRCRLNTYGRRAFLIAGPTVWNSLPDELRDPACGSGSFKQFLRQSSSVSTNDQRIRGFLK